MAVESTNNISAKQHESYVTFTIIAVILPIVGLILGIVYLSKSEALDKKLGEHLLAFSILFSIIWSIAYYILTSSPSAGY